MRRGTFLVLWQLLARTLHNQDSYTEVSPGNYEIVFRVDEAERRALRSLTGAIESGIPEVNHKEMPGLIRKEREWIMSRPQ